MLYIATDDFYLNPNGYACKAAQFNIVCEEDRIKATITMKNQKKHKNMQENTVFVENEDMFVYWLLFFARLGPAFWTVKNNKTKMIFTEHNSITIGQTKHLKL